MPSPPRKLTVLTANVCVLFFASQAWAQQAINEGLDGSWLNPETPGQGILIDVDESIGFIFVAWFTYTTDAATIDGSESHRWLTAQGNYSGNSAELTLSETSGGIFDAASTADTNAVGTFSISFSSCTDGLVAYQFSDDGPSGEFSISRLAPDVLCGDLTAPASKVSITYLGNAGVFIADEDAGVLIDAFANRQGWVGLPNSAANDLTSAVPPYDKALFVAATHNHGDHISPTQINAFFGNQSVAQGWFTASARGAFPTDRLVNLTPQRFAADSTSSDSVTLTAISTRHFDQFGNDFSGVENYAFQVEIGGKRIVHCGDIDYASNNFQAILDATGSPPDVIILPTFNTLISAENRDLVRQFFPDSRVVALHFQGSLVNSESSQVASLFPDAVIFDQALEVFDVE